MWRGSIIVVKCLHHLVIFPVLFIVMCTCLFALFIVTTSSSTLMAVNTIPFYSGLLNVLIIVSESSSKLPRPLIFVYFTLCDHKT